VWAGGAGSGSPADAAALADTEAGLQRTDNLPDGALRLLQWAHAVDAASEL
jgi:hypothetical protein